MRRSRIAFEGAAFASDLGAGCQHHPKYRAAMSLTILKMLDVLSRRRCRRSNKSHTAKWLATVQLVNGNLRAFLPRSIKS
jgi:hypothetical protein